MENPLISLVVPIYNESKNILEFVELVSRPCNEAQMEYEIIFAVDPSSDGTEVLLRELNKQDSRIKMIRMSRRFGQPACTLAGIEAAKGDAIIVMDADMQDPPEVISDLIKEWRNGSLIVLAQRRSRKGEPIIKKFVSDLGYRFLNRFSEVPIPKNTGDFRLLDRKVVNELSKFKEANAFLRGLVSLVGFENKVVYFNRPPRKHGETKYNKWLGSLKIAFNGVIGYTTALLSLSMLVGMLISISALLMGISLVAAKIGGLTFPMGYATTIVIILTMGGLNLFFIGILGLYVGKIYEESKSRPKYIVEEKVGW